MLTEYHSIRPLELGDVSGELLAVRQHIEGLNAFPDLPEIDVDTFAQETDDAKLKKLVDSVFEHAVSSEELPKHLIPERQKFWLNFQTIEPGMKPLEDDNFHIDPTMLLFSDNPHMLTRFMSGRLEMDDRLRFNRIDHGPAVDTAVIQAYLDGKLTTHTYAPGKVLYVTAGGVHVSQRNTTNETQRRLLGLIGMRMPRELDYEMAKLAS